jgi:hypothetical protein
VLIEIFFQLPLSAMARTSGVLSSQSRNFAAVRRPQIGSWRVLKVDARHPENVIGFFEADIVTCISDTTPMSAQNMPLPAAHASRKLDRDLAVARRKRGISTADMAGRLFVSRDTLWRLERS